MEVSTLQEKLTRGEPVTVLDIRPTEQRVEWSIPGSLWADAYGDIRSGDFGSLDTLSLPVGTPVVVVCEAGKTSRRAADRLRTRGLDADTLEGGMRAWSLAWNLAVQDLTGGVRVFQVRRVGKGCLSYLVTSGREALVIDAAVDPDVYLNLAASRGFRIMGAVDTHIHADHLSRSRHLARSLEVPLYLPAQGRVQFSFTPLNDGDRVTFGEAGLHVMHTPGHTWESCSFVVPGAVLTGDTLFLDGVGRTDLEAAPDEAVRRAAALHRSLAQVFTLPPATLVFPGHTARPPEFDGIALTAPLGEVHERLPLLRLRKENSQRPLTSRTPSTPPNHHRIVEINETGAWLDEPVALEAGANRCAMG